MKHRVLSLIGALVLCLGVCPVQALAVELPEDAPQFVDSGTPPEEPTAPADATVMPLADEILTAPLDFTNVGDGEGQTPAEGPGYKWSGDRESGWLLELDNLHMELEENTYFVNDGQTAIRFPNKGHLTVVVKGENILEIPGWNALYGRVTNHSVGEYIDEDSVSILGEGENASFTFMGARTGIRSTYAIEIRNVTIRGTTTDYGIFSFNGGITLDGVDCTIENGGISTACIVADNGSLVVRNSKLDLYADKQECIFVRDGDFTVTDSEINAVGRAATSGTVIALGKWRAERTLTASFSGNSKITCTNEYGSNNGLTVQGHIVIDAPTTVRAQTKTESGGYGALLAFEGYGGITLNDVKVITPLNGEITPPYGGSNVYTVRVGDISAPLIEIGPARLTVSPEPACMYGEPAEVTVESAPTYIKGNVSVCSGEKELGTGSLHNAITLDTTGLRPGAHTLVAKMVDNNDIFTEFTLFVRAKPIVQSSPGAVVRYGDPLSTSVPTGGTVIDPVSQQPIQGSWSWKDGTVLAAMENDGYVAIFTPTDTDSFIAVEYTVKPTITPKPLAVTSASATDRVYDGTDRVLITGAVLDGIINGDDVSLVTADLTGTVSDADAGRYTSVALPSAMTLTGPAASYYTLPQPTAPVATDVSITKAPALAAKPGDLPVVNRQANTYTYGLQVLLPDVPAGMSLGSSAVTYELGTVDLGSYYAGGAVINGHTLTLPIQKVDSEDVKEIGIVAVIIHSGNFEDMTATIHLRTVNKILPEGEPILSAAFITYGQQVGSITLSGVMRDTVNDQDVPGTFAWSNPGDRPAVQERYAAEWIFTPEDDRTYTTVTGTASIRVLPASISSAVIVLEPASFRYDGAAHSPAITSVRLDGATLTADVDYTAAIPAESEAGTYTVTITGKGNYTGIATAIFTINPVKTEDVILPDGTQVQLSVESGLTSVPEGLQGTSFHTIPAIERELRAKVTAALSSTGDNVAVYDVRLQYLENGVWKDVDPTRFPAGGVTAILPYPDGTNGTDFTFTVQHMISHGEQAGEVENLVYTVREEGLECHFASLSPVAVGWQAKTALKPTPSATGSGSGSQDNDEYNFWQKVRREIENAQSGDAVKVNARSYDQMPWTVMDALKKNGNVALIIQWSGGTDIVIPAGKALDEALRIYYPLSYLDRYNFGRVSLAALNPETGGVWVMEAPLAAEPAVTDPTDPRRGLAESPELAERGIEKAIPGVYEAKATPTEAEVSAQTDRKSVLPTTLIFLGALTCGGVWVWKKHKDDLSMNV